VRGRALGRLRPYLHFVDVARAHVVARDDAADGPAARRARPDEILVDGIGRGPSALASTHRAPLAAPDSGVRAEELLLALARPHRRFAVLLVSVDEVRHPVVDGDVIHLRDRELNAMPRAAPRGRDAETAVVRHREPVAVRGIEPDVEVIAARNLLLGKIDHRLSAIQRLREVRCEEVRLVRIVGLDTHAIVVRGATRGLQVGAHELPMLAAIIRAEHPTRVLRLAIARYPVAGLDLSV